MSKINQPERKFARRADEDIRNYIGGVLVNNQQLYSRGLPDRFLVKNSRVAWLEYKASAGSHVDRLQLIWLSRFRKQGCLALVAYPENWEIVLQELACFMEV